MIPETAKAPILPGALEILEYFHKLNFKQAVATSSRQVLLDVKVKSNPVWGESEIWWVEIVSIFWGYYFGSWWACKALYIMRMLMYRTSEARARHIPLCMRDAAQQAIGMYCVWRFDQWNQGRLSCRYTSWLVPGGSRNDGRGSPQYRDSPGQSRGCESSNKNTEWFWWNKVKSSLYERCFELLTKSVLFFALAHQFWYIYISLEYTLLWQYCNQIRRTLVVLYENVCLHRKAVKW